DPGILWSRRWRSGVEGQRPPSVEAVDQPLAALATLELPIASGTRFRSREGRYCLRRVIHRDGFEEIGAQWLTGSEATRIGDRELNIEGHGRSHAAISRRRSLRNTCAAKSGVYA